MRMRSPIQAGAVLVIVELDADVESKCRGCGERN
jgi:hypothetical protein